MRCATTAPDLQVLGLVVAPEAGGRRCSSVHVPAEPGRLYCHVSTGTLPRVLRHAAWLTVCFLLQSYHAGFSLGFNCGEAVNFASADWIPIGECHVAFSPTDRAFALTLGGICLSTGAQAVEHYRKQRRPVSLDQEQLLLETAKAETSPDILQYVLPELHALREREYESRLHFFKLGMRPVTLEQYTGGPVSLVRRDLSLSLSLSLCFLLFLSKKKKKRGGEQSIKKARCGKEKEGDREG